jgi:hypothetical protein
VRGARGRASNRTAASTSEDDADPFVGSQRVDFEESELKALENLHRTPVKGWFSACDLDSPANIVPGAENSSELTLGQKFIWDHQKSFGFCENPWLKRLHGAMQ